MMLNRILKSGTLNFDVSHLIMLELNRFIHLGNCEQDIFKVIRKKSSTIVSGDEFFGNLKKVKKKVFPVNLVNAIEFSDVFVTED